METKVKGTIFNIQRYSVHDGKGIRTNIFFKGCPLSCKWCSNPESQNYLCEMCVTESNCIRCMECLKACKTNAITLTTWDRSKCNECRRCIDVCPTGAREFLGREMSVEEIAKEVIKDWQFYKDSGGGATFSGGEPLTQPEFAYELAKTLKNSYIDLAIETCGHANWEKASKVLEQMDQILYDIKHMDSQKHKLLTGVGNELILENATKAAALGKKMVIRLPVIGRMNSDDANIAATAKFTKEIGVQELHLLPYHRFGESKYQKLGIAYQCDAFTPSDEEMERLRELATSYGIQVQIGG